MSELPPQAIFANSLAAFRHQGPDRRGKVGLPGRAACFMLTAAAQLGLLVAFLFGVQIAGPAIPDAKPLAVSIEKQAPVLAPVLNIIPKMMSAEAIHVPAPEFTVAVAPSPVLVSVAVPTVAAPVPAAAAPVTMGPQLGAAYPDYMTLVLQFLQKELDEQHPHGALGTAEVFFTIDRAGHILFSKILKSSGRASVDNNALLLMQTSGALPPVPGSLAGDTFSAHISITYRAGSLSSRFNHLNR